MHYAGFAEFRYLQTSNIPESAMKTRNEMLFHGLLRELQPVLFWNCEVFLLISMIGIVGYGIEQDTSFDNTAG